MALREMIVMDIVMIKEDSMSLLKWLSDHKISAYRHNEEEMYPFGGFYFNLGNIKINIINAYDESDLLFWERRTDALKKIAPILDRGLRIRAFHTSILEEES